MATRPDPLAEPVLVLAPTGADAQVAGDLVGKAGARAAVCSTVKDVAAALERGAAALVLASEALEDDSAEALWHALARQPAWSDIPVILLTLHGQTAGSAAVEALLENVGNVSLLERPFRAASFVSLLRVALRGRRRQFEVERLLNSERKARADAAWERRRADRRERELRASEERFRLIADSIPQLAWMAQPSGRLFWFNRRWYEFSGAAPDDPRAGWKAWIEAQHPQHLPAADHRWRESLATGASFDMEFPLRGRDGRFRWFLTRAVPAPGADGRPTLWFGTSTDITEQRATAQALQQSQERLLLAVDTARLALWTIDPVEGQLSCSDALRVQLGVPAPSPSYEEFWRAVHPDDRDELERRMRDAMARGDLVAAEYRIVRPDGETRWILARARPAPGDGVALVRLVGVSLDITERKLTEERREAALAAERAARSEAERVARMKDEFLATLSHELRTPLNAVLGWAEVLHRAGAASADFERGVSAIARNARLQAQLIEDLLDTSRIVSGTLALDLSAVSLTDVVDAAIESVQPSAAARRVEIVREFEGACEVRGDRRRLQQIVWNLLTNAVKFSPSGNSVTVRLSVDDRRCVLEVIDRGQGIPREFLPHLFERFRQQDSSRKRHRGGLGLGLSIVRHLVHLHGGTVSGDSQGPGTGAAFRVTLPRLARARVEKAPEEAPPPAETHMQALVDARILVVDDEVDARDLLARILRERHAEVLLAASAEEGLALARDARPDLIVSDIGMPGRDGLEFIRDVRNLPGAPGSTPAIALTAFARSEDRDLALQSGFQRHLAKPLDALALAAACAELLASRIGGRAAQVA